MRRTWLAVIAVLLGLAPMVLPSAPARADTYTYEGLSEGTFASWAAPSGNIYTAHRRMSVRFNRTTGAMAFRANVWCEVNGQPATCTIYLDGALWFKGCAPASDCALGDFGLRRWDPVKTKSGHIFQGIDHNRRSGYSYLSFAFIEVFWVAPQEWSIRHQECSKWVYYNATSVANAFCT